MKMRYILLTVGAVLLTGGWLARVIWLNTATPFAQTVYYQMGDTVSYKDDFFYSSKEQHQDYTVTVKGVTLVSLQDYADKYGLELYEQGPYGPVFWPDNVLDLEVEFTRTDGGKPANAEEELGIDLFSTLLTTPNLRLPIKWELFNQQYPQLGEQRGFQLRPGTSMTFHLPYAPETATDQMTATKRYLAEEMFYLNVTLYPHKKLIKVHV